MKIKMWRPEDSHCLVHEVDDSQVDAFKAEGWAVVDDVARKAIADRKAIAASRAVANDADAPALDANTAALVHAAVEKSQLPVGELPQAFVERDDAAEGH